jgi:hypothetical protein
LIAFFFGQTISLFLMTLLAPIKGPLPVSSSLMPLRDDNCFFLEAKRPPSEPSDARGKAFPAELHMATMPKRKFSSETHALQKGWMVSELKD